MDNHMLLELKDLEVVYQTDFENVYALNKVTLSLNAGETVLVQALSKTARGRIRAILFFFI